MGQNISDYSTVGGKVGNNSPAADGAFESLRLGKTKELIVGEAHGRYYEAASRGKLFIAVTAVAGVAPGTALSTAPAFSLWNPVNSGILVTIKKVFIGYLSGTLGAGFMAHTQNSSQLTDPSSGTAIVPVCSLLNGTGGTAKPHTSSTISATSTLIRPSLNLNAIAGAGDAGPSLGVDMVDDEIIVPAGVAYCLQGIAAAGTSPKIVIGVVYEEITLP